VVLAVRRPPAPHWVATLLRGYEFVREWSMIEIMLLGVLVALIKIAELATVIPGLALFVLGAGLPAGGDGRDLRSASAWARIEWAAGSDQGAAACARALR
jgi:paraquat-inducible protein A